MSDTTGKHVTLAAEAGTYTLTGAPVRVRMHDPLPADHPFHNLIGQLVSAWAHFEHAIDLLIWDLSGKPHSEAACMTRQIVSVTARLDALIDLAGEKGKAQDVINDLEALKPRAFELQQLRNRIVHDAWYLDKETKEVGQFRSMPKNKPHYGIQDIHEADVTATIQELKDQRDKVAKFWNRLFA